MSYVDEDGNHTHEAQRYLELAREAADVGYPGTGQVYALMSIAESLASLARAHGTCTCGHAWTRHGYDGCRAVTSRTWTTDNPSPEEWANCACMEVAP